MANTTLMITMFNKYIREELERHQLNEQLTLLQYRQVLCALADLFRMAKFKNKYHYIPREKELHQQVLLQLVRDIFDEVKVIDANVSQLSTEIKASKSLLVDRLGQSYANYLRLAEARDVLAKSNNITVQNRYSNWYVSQGDGVPAPNVKTSLTSPTMN